MTLIINAPFSASNSKSMDLRLQCGTVSLGIGPQDKKVFFVDSKTMISALDVFIKTGTVVRTTFFFEGLH